MPNEINIPSRVARCYQITVEGRIDPSWSDWLGGMQVISWQENDGRQMSTLSGILVDQTALRGLLTRLWDLNLVLHALQRGDPAASQNMHKDILR